MVSNFWMWSLLVVLGVLVSLFPQHFLHCRLWSGLIGPHIPILLLGSGSDLFSLAVHFCSMSSARPIYQCYFMKVFLFSFQALELCLAFLLHAIYWEFFLLYFYPLTTKALMGCPIYVFPSIQRTGFSVIFPLIMQSKRE